MRLDDIRTDIRLALLDLGRDPHVKLPTHRAALESMLKMLRIEQSYSTKSNLRPELKNRIRTSVS